MNKQFILQKLVENNLTQTKLANILNIDKAQVTRLLNGERQLKATEVKPLANFLKTTELIILNNLH